MGRMFVLHGLQNLVSLNSTLTHAKLKKGRIINESVDLNIYFTEKKIP